MTGDGWSQAKVVWKKFATHPIFLPWSAPNFVKTQDMKEEEAREAFSKASKLEARGKLDEALNLYQQIVSNYPETQTAKDADVALKSLQKKIEE